MKFKIQKQAFAGGLAQMARLAATGLIDNLRVAVAEGRMGITATNLAIVLTSKTDVLQEKDGETAEFYINAKILSDVVDELPDGEIGASVGNVTLNLDWENGGCALPIVREISFPPGLRLGQDPDKPVHHVTVPREALARAFGGALPLLDEDDFQPVKGSVLFDVDGGGVTLVGTDGQAMVTYSMGEDARGDAFRFLFPKSAAALLRSILDKDEDGVTLHCDTVVATCATGSHEMAVRCPELRYPSYRTLIDTARGNEYGMKARRLDLARCVRRVAALTGARDVKDHVIVTLSQGAAAAEVMAQDLTGKTSGRDTVECSWDGPDMKIAFRIFRLLEILGCTDAEEVTLRITAPNKPAMVMAEGDEGTVAVIMPVPFGEAAPGAAKKKGGAK